MPATLRKWTVTNTFRCFATTDLVSRGQDRLRLCAGFFKTSFTEMLHHKKYNKVEEVCLHF